MKTVKEHNDLVESISYQIREHTRSGNAKTIRFFHGGTNSTRAMSTEKYHYIDTSKLNAILEINTTKQYALVEPSVSMDQLVDATLQHSLIPCVVPEFPGITCGGAVNGASLESSSFRYGQFNNTCTEYEIILGNGDIIHVSARSHADLFYGISGSYGSLGLLTLIRVKLIPSSEYIRLTYTKTKGYDESVKVLMDKKNDASVSFLDGILFSKNVGVVITGTLSDERSLELTTFSKASDQWFFEHAQEIVQKHMIFDEYVPVRDYLFRYNRGAFWMGSYVFPLLHIPQSRITKFLFNPFLHTRKLYDGLHDLQIMQNYFIQDFYTPVDKTVDLLRFSEHKLGIFPVWLCPIKAAKHQEYLSPSYIDRDMLIDVGIWGSTRKFLHAKYRLNTLFEKYSKHNEIKKMYYAEVYYSKRSFWDIYDKEWYTAI